MIKKIFLDMDGVLCDFEARYTELYGPRAAGEDRNQKNFSKNWKHFIETRQFETLDPFPGSTELLEFVKSLNIPVEILSSSGGAKHHSEVREQKITWLTRRGISFPVNIVPGRRVKKFYASKRFLLIDDVPELIDSFSDAGGLAILHKDVNETIQKMKEMITNE